MIRYIAKRVLMMIPVLLAVSFVVYFLMDLAPGDLVDSMNTQDMSLEQIEALRKEYGLDGTVFERYIRYIGRLLKGDLGYSYTMNMPVFDAFMQRFPATLKLALASILVALVIAIPLGIAAATHHRTWIDGVSMVGGLLGLSMPNFWVGLLLILLFSSKLGWLPSTGSDTWLHLIMPAITVGTGQAGTLTRITRSSMLDVIRADYLRTARAKGVPEKQVIRKHALKNALIPIITVFGSTLGNALGGAVTTETIFAWPGVGRLTVNAVNSRDMALATGCIILFTVFLNISILLVDIAYAFVDPRIKAQYSK